MCTRIKFFQKTTHRFKTEKKPLESQIRHAKVRHSLTKNLKFTNRN